MAATQELHQKVCQRFGWSEAYSKRPTEDGTAAVWRVEIVTGLGQGERHVFETPEAYAIAKKGKNAVAVLALEGLSQVRQEAEARPAMELMQVFESIELPILDSAHSASWARLWRDPPAVVGIDTEGNQKGPPVLVQIATEEFVILEAPRGQLSPDLQRLLRDDKIAKVFCDNFDHKDKASLGLLAAAKPDRHPPKSADSNGGADVLLYTEPPILDLESLAVRRLGPVRSARGLAKIVTLVMPELGCRIEKPKMATGKMFGRFSKVSRFAMIEQGKAKPLNGVSDLEPLEQRYAALDAWCTLRAYHRIMDVMPAGGETSSIIAD